MRIARSLTILYLALVGVVGCGQKGALYLPDEAAEETPEATEEQEENGETEES